MLTLQPDPRWLVDSFDYEPKQATDRYGKPVMGSTITLNKVRIDWHKTYARDSTQLTKVGDGVIYIYAAFSTGIPTNGFVEDSNVIIDGKAYKVKEVKRYHRITSAAPYSWELVIL